QRLFLFIERRIWLAHGCTGRSSTSAQQRKKVLLEDQAQHQQHQRPADADVPAAKLESTPTAARLVAAIFDVGVVTARCPSHGCSPEHRDLETSRKGSVAIIPFRAAAPPQAIRACEVYASTRSGASMRISVKSESKLAAHR